MVTRVVKDQHPPDHPDRFDERPQVLCSESLTEPCYWEAERSGWVQIGVTYRGLSRKGRDDDCLLGGNEMSWSLVCYDDSYSVSHNSKLTAIPVCPSRDFNRVAVYLDCPTGTLSFYEVSPDTLTHLYTFQNKFTEPLIAGFWLGSSYSSVCLCE